MHPNDIVSQHISPRLILTGKQCHWDVYITTVSIDWNNNVIGMYITTVSIDWEKHVIGIYTNRGDIHPNDIVIPIYTNRGDICIPMTLFPSQY
jgi:hypothetical protein